MRTYIHTYGSTRVAAVVSGCCVEEGDGFEGVVSWQQRQRQQQQQKEEGG